jgi:hypothetical protein
MAEAVKVSPVRLRPIGVEANVFVANRPEANRIDPTRSWPIGLTLLGLRLVRGRQASPRLN